MKFVLELRKIKLIGGTLFNHLKMATIQSQINILTSNLIYLYKKLPKLVKLEYNTNNVPPNNIKKNFMSYPTYVLSMDFDKNIECEIYETTLEAYKTTVDNHTFEYVVPRKYNKSSSMDASAFMNEFLHCYADDTNNLKLLFNFPQLINLNTDLKLSDSYVFDGSSSFIYDNDDFKDNIQRLNKNGDPTTTRTYVNNSIPNSLFSLIRDNEPTCIDLINDKFESIVYNNTYELNDDGNLVFKKYNNHILKKNYEITTTNNVYILDCCNNIKYNINI